VFRNVFEDVTETNVSLSGDVYWRKKQNGLVSENVPYRHVRKLSESMCQSHLSGELV
jgi:hypothetical protein